MSVLPPGKQWVSHNGRRERFRRMKRMASRAELSIAQTVRLEGWLDRQPADVNRAAARAMVINTAAQQAADAGVMFAEALDAVLLALVKEAIDEHVTRAAQPAGAVA